MKLTREELLRQKALVEAQLHWLDTKLAETESEGALPSASQKPLSPVVDTPTSQTPLADDGLPEVSAVPLPESGGNGEGVTATQKIGCIILVILVCAGILAGLFLLPYLLY